MTRTRVHYNDDATELWDVEPGRARESLIELIDLVIDNVPIDIYSIECALPDMCEHQTKVGEVLGSRFPGRISTNQRSRGVEALRQEGTDHLSVYTAHLHERGIQCVAEVRMGDTHHRHVDFDEAGCPLFTVEHPEWVIKRKDGVEEVAMDYSYPEVREHRLAIMSELANDYDTDGLELNFNRWSKHFEQDKGVEKASIMTAFVEQIHTMLSEAAAARGRDKLLLGIRMPASMDECWAAGCDVETWVRNGWIDYLVAAEYNDTWPGTRVDEFVPFCKGRCELFAQICNITGSVWKGKPVITGRGDYMADSMDPCYAAMRLNNAEARGAAANYYAWGADGVGFWNISCHTGTRGKGNAIGPAARARMFEWMNEAIDPERIAAGSCTYHYVPLYKGLSAKKGNYFYCRELCSPSGGVRSQVLTFPPDARRTRQPFRFRMADGRDGKSLNGLLRFRLLYAGPAAPLAVDINGTPIPDSVINRKLDESNADMPATWFEISLQDAPPFCGDNELGLTWQGDCGSETPCMEEIEVTVE